MYEFLPIQLLHVTIVLSLLVATHGLSCVSNQLPTYMVFIPRWSDDTAGDGLTRPVLGWHVQ